MGGCNDATRGIAAGGDSSNVIDYFTMATSGNATDFGDLTLSRQVSASTSDTTRGLFANGWTGSVYSDTIDYITIQTTGNATDFGNLSVGSSSAEATGDATKGIFVLGSQSRGTIEYVTIASIGNTTDFGDLSGTTRGQVASCSGD